MKKMKFLSLFAVAVLLSSATLPKSVFAASSVEDDGAAANTVVAAATTSASAAATAGIIATAVGAAISPPAPSIGSASTGSLDGRISSTGMVFFNSRDIAAKSGKSAGSTPRGGFWVQGGYTVIDNDEAGGQFDGNVFNVVAGLDFKPKRFNGKMVAGLALSYENVDITTVFNAGTFEGSGITVVPYVGFLLNKIWAVDAAVGIGFLNYDNSRTSNAVKGEFDATRYFGATNLTGTFRKKRVRFSPKFGVLVLREIQDSYNETGTSTAAVKETTIKLTRLSAGGELGYQMKKMEPYVHGTMQYDVERNDPVTLTTGVVASDDALGAELGAGINFNGSPRVSGNIKYSTSQFKNEIVSHSVSGRIRFNF